MEVGIQYEVMDQESPQTATKKSKRKRKREQEKIDEARVLAQNSQAAINVDPSEQAHMNVKIEVIYDQTDKTPPVVGYFPSRYDPLKNNESNNLKEPHFESKPSPSTVKFYRTVHRTKVEKSSEGRNEKGKSFERMELVVSPNASNVEFVGKSYKGEAMAAQLCTYALGILNKETNTLKIMPIAGNKIFRLEPKVQGSSTSNEDPSVLENVELTGEMKADKMRELNIRYGSKRSINQDKKLQALNQGDDPESQKDLGQKIDDVPVNREALESTNANVARNIPPHNTSATTPREAYPLDRIILPGEWDFLEDIYRILQGGAELTSDAYPTFVCNRINKLQEIQDEVEKKTVARILSYISHLIKFKDHRGSFAKNHRCPSILRHKFEGMFNPGGGKLSLEKIDLLISYVLVLALYADDFRTNPADITRDLKVDHPTIRKHFSNLGCKFVHEKKQLVAILPVPLKYPKLNQKRGRREL